MFIDSATDLNINNVTGSKQNVTSQTGLLLLASDQDSNFYLHNFLSLGGELPTRRTRREPEARRPSTAPMSA